jgi:hypothetical protein
VGPLEDTLPVPVAEVAPDRRLRRTNFSGQLLQGNKPLAGNQFQHTLTAFFHQHGKALHRVLEETSQVLITCDGYFQ